MPVLQVDRSKKPSLKILGDNRAKSPSTISDSHSGESGRIVPDRSTKPMHDGRSTLTEEEKSRVHAETAALLEKNRREKELRERQQQEQKERLKREKEEQEQKEQEQKAKEEQKEKERKEKLQQSKEDREQKERDEQIKREQEEKERGHRETVEAKKQNKNEPENIGAKRIEVDKISMEEREKGSRTPETQKRALGDASQTFVTVPGKVSEKERSPLM